MIWTAWNNGKNHKTGAGYGLKIPLADRDPHFDRRWRTVFIELPSGKSHITVEANVAKDSFWGAQCRELISRDIGRWLIDEGHAPWPEGSPPNFEAVLLADRRFRVKGRK